MASDTIWSAVAFTQMVSVLPNDLRMPGTFRRSCNPATSFPDLELPDENGDLHRAVLPMGISRLALRGIPARPVDWTAAWHLLSSKI